MLSKKKTWNEEFRKKNEDRAKEETKYENVEIIEVSAEVRDLKNTVKEIIIKADSHQQKLSDKERKWRVIKQANNIIE